MQRLRAEVEADRPDWSSLASSLEDLQRELARKNNQLQELYQQNMDQARLLEQYHYSGTIGLQVHVTAVKIVLAGSIKVFAYS